MLKVLEVSCRKNDGLLGTFLVGDLRFFDAPSGAEISVGEFRALLAGKRVLNFAHGYHNKERQADDLTSLIASYAANHELNYDVLVLFSWPGGLTYAGFGMAVARTKACGAKFRELLLLEDCAKDLAIASHSLGAGVAAEALAFLPVGLVSRWTALAAAIPNDSLSKGGKYEQAAASAGRIFAPYSARDGVLKFAYPIGSFGQTALGRTGPKGDWPHTIFAPDLKAAIYSHSGAYKADGVYALWEAWKVGLAA